MFWGIGRIVCLIEGQGSRGRNRGGAAGDGTGRAVAHLQCAGRDCRGAGEGVSGSKCQCPRRGIGVIQGEGAAVAGNHAGEGDALPVRINLEGGAVRTAEAAGVIEIVDGGVLESATAKDNCSRRACGLIAQGTGNTCVLRRADIQDAGVDLRRSGVGVLRGEGRGARAGLGESASAGNCGAAEVGALRHGVYAIDGQSTVIDNRTGGCELAVVSAVAEDKGRARIDGGCTRCRYLLRLESAQLCRRV